MQRFPWHWHCGLISWVVGALGLSTYRTTCPWMIAAFLTGIHPYLSPATNTKPPDSQTYSRCLRQESKTPAAAPTGSSGHIVSIGSVSWLWDVWDLWSTGRKELNPCLFETAFLGGPSLHVRRSLQVREAQRRGGPASLFSLRPGQPRTRLREIQSSGGGCRDGSQCTKCHECFWSRVPAGPNAGLRISREVK